MDSIDDILSEAPSAEPSPGFSARVMSAVRREARTQPPIAFPWARLALGLAACGMWLALGYVALRGGDPERVRALARSEPLLAGVGLALALACVRFARFCVRV
jgi:hypothetical protein